MNPKQFMDLLKNLQKIMKCPSCGAVYKIEEIQFLGQIDGLFLLQMSCQKCNLPVWMNFMLSKDSVKKQVGLSDLNDKDTDFFLKSEISSDEIINFHTFLRGFDGNFKRALKS